MRIDEWRFHLGVHKTATTHIQRELDARRTELLDQGVLFIPQDRARELFHFQQVPRPVLWRVKNKLYCNPGLPKAFASRRFVTRCASSLVDLLELEAGTASRIVISDEKLIGKIDSIFQNGFYQDFSRLNIINEIARRDVIIRLFVSLRSFDSFLPSAYAQALRTVPAARLNFRDYSARLTRTPPSWTKLINIIRKAVPNAKVVVWDYAQYSNNSLAIQNLITGAVLAPAAVADRPKRTVSPSARAIQMAETTHADSWKERLKIVNEIFRSFPVSPENSAFLPFSEFQVTLLRERFAEDLEQIKKMSRVEVIDF